MTQVLIALSGARVWTLANEDTVPCGFWPEEFVIPHRTFIEAGFDVTIATPSGLLPVPDKGGFDPPAGTFFREYIESVASELNSPRRLEDLQADDYDLIFIPGGHGPMEDLSSSEALGSLLVAFTNLNKLVVAVCHGSAGLISARANDGSWIFDGHKMTGFTNIEEGHLGYNGRAHWLLEDRLKSLGAIFSSATDPWQPHVVVDRGLLTGQNPASTEPLVHRVLAELS